MLISAGKLVFKGFFEKNHQVPIENSENEIVVNENNSYNGYPIVKKKNFFFQKF